MHKKILFGPILILFCFSFKTRKSRKKEQHGALPTGQVGKFKNGTLILRSCDIKKIKSSKVFKWRQCIMFRRIVKSINFIVKKKISLYLISFFNKALLITFSVQIVVAEHCIVNLMWSKKVFLMIPYSLNNFHSWRLADYMDILVIFLFYDLVVLGNQKMNCCNVIWNCK